MDRSVKAVEQRVGPLTAMALLELFLQRQWDLSEDEADELFGIVIATLERARDESYRLRKEHVTQGDKR